MLGIWSDKSPTAFAIQVLNDGTMEMVTNAMKKVVVMMSNEERDKVSWGAENLVDKLEHMELLYPYYTDALAEVLEMFWSCSG